MTLAYHAPNGKPPAESFRFGGFSIPNGTYVPDEVFDVLMPRLSDIELRVLLYIIRRTFGFKKGADDISLKQMVEGIQPAMAACWTVAVACHVPSVSKAVRGLAKKNIVTATANYSPQRGNEATTYTLVFAEHPSKDDDEGGRNGVTRGGRNAVATQETDYKRQRDKGNSKIRMTSPV